MTTRSSMNTQRRTVFTLPTSPASRAAIATAIAVCSLAGLAATFGGCAIQKLDETELLSRSYAEGREAYLRGDYETALVEFDAILDKRPQSVTANHDVGRTLFALGRPGEAIEPLGVAHELRPYDPGILNDYISALGAADRAQELLLVLNRLSAERGDVTNTVTAAREAVRLGYMDDAEQALLVAIREHGNEIAAPRLALAELYDAAGDRQRAVQELRYALWIEPDSVEVRQMIRSMGEIPGPSFQRAPTSILEP